MTLRSGTELRKITPSMAPRLVHLLEQVFCLALAPHFAAPTPTLALGKAGHRAVGAPAAALLAADA